MFCPAGKGNQTECSKELGFSKYVSLSSTGKKDKTEYLKELASSK